MNGQNDDSQMGGASPLVRARQRGKRLIGEAPRVDALRARLGQSEWIVCAEVLRILGDESCEECDRLRSENARLRTDNDHLSRALVDFTGNA